MGPERINDWVLAELPGTDEWLPVYVAAPAYALRRRNGKKPPAYRGIYFLVRGSVVIWVGKTTDLDKRIYSHRISGRRFDYVLFRQVPLKDDLESLEMYWTKKLNPAENSKRTKRTARRYMEAIMFRDYKRQSKSLDILTQLQ